MEIIVEKIGAVTRIAPKGVIDISSSAQFGSNLSKVIASGCQRLVIDMKDVPYIGSAGFRCLLIAEKEAQRAGGRLGLCGLDDGVHRLFETSAFTDIFIIAPTVEDCIARLATAS